MDSSQVKYALHEFPRSELRHDTEIWFCQSCSEPPKSNRGRSMKLCMLEELLWCLPELYISWSHPSGLIVGDHIWEPVAKTCWLSMSQMDWRGSSCLCSVQRYGSIFTRFLTSSLNHQFGLRKICMTKFNGCTVFSAARGYVIQASYTDQDSTRRAHAKNRECKLRGG